MAVTLPDTGECDGTPILPAGSAIFWPFSTESPLATIDDRAQLVPMLSSTTTLDGCRAAVIGDPLVLDLFSGGWIPPRNDPLGMHLTPLYTTPKLLTTRILQATWQYSIEPSSWPAARLRVRREPIKAGNIV